MGCVVFHVQIAKNNMIQNPSVYTMYILYISLPLEYVIKFYAILLLSSGIHAASFVRYEKRNTLDYTARCSSIFVSFPLLFEWEFIFKFAPSFLLQPKLYGFACGPTTTMLN
ncbi:unnamed protein product [Orchesella dallaii]|uniref:Uncharacterized protein n=1 Tax=Orchesella dallaii TaxID=48710 RepID=A0ABP1QWF7_9HEXA